ncbi:hypothetical protein GC176_15670 [bacterium]|nr:hypothetical protein [bacterium]
MDRVKAYRTCAVPLSILLSFGGVVVAVLLWVVRVPVTSPFPFVESESLNRHVIGVLSVACVGIGVGLFFKNRVAWHVLRFYLGLGVLIPALSALDDRIVASRGIAFTVFSCILNAMIGIGLYFALRPVFAAPMKSQGPRKPASPSDQSGIR